MRDFLRQEKMPEHPLVVGAGLMGAWTFYHLALAGEDPVLVPGSSNHVKTSDHPSALFRIFHGSEKLSGEAAKSLPYFRSLLSIQPNLIADSTGSLYLDHQFEYENLKRKASCAASEGWPMEVLSPEEGNERFPAFNWNGKVGVFEPKAFRCSPNELIYFLIEMGMSKGGVVRAAESIEKGKFDLSRWVLKSTIQELYGSHLFLCTGIWTPEICARLGLKFTLGGHQARQIQIHSYSIDSVGQPPIPSFFDSTNGTYGYSDGGKLFAGVRLEGLRSSDGSYIATPCSEAVVRTERQLFSVFSQTKKRRLETTLSRWDLELNGGGIEEHLGSSVTFSGGKCGTGFKSAPSTSILPVQDFLQRRRESVA